ncbi:sugar ABC transporter ATP-binding protein [Treponema phagedenis]|uniref:sugar ABC transporter ATP-binding protein n=1 Tax=Treponema phagedenis TaxID=162 RepID=UPI0004647DCF|nr:sugar ABC transporter ATP-binding protein [Treponema phagedenis]QEK03637.1 sugar ABC transporter ATP-binding protein [Treponema phagedenis]QEK09255.1 sugar ABC transporter ATP-binding protein [Treponema phagedenis]QSH94482.1 sugar ABC transporter ATP-binding protein [Treponema phagedenis]
MSENEYILQMNNISKFFPGVRALDDVHLHVKRGEVHALMGENGAGKSTLMKCLIGIQPVTSGEIIFDGKTLPLQYSPAEALSWGISMIHQELSPVAERPIMENIWLGREPLNKFGLVNHKKMYEMTEAILQQVDLSENPKTKVGTLTVAKIQMVEIAKAISYDAKLIIMDEPTSALTDREIEKLFEVITKLKSEGKSIIYITHKLDEISRITDSVSIFRDGKFIATHDTKKLSMEQMITEMVGRSVNNMFPKIPCEQGEEILSVENLSDGKHFSDVSFSLRKGEILGIAGLVGSGRTEIIETIFGIRPATSGTIKIAGEEIRIKNPRDAIKHKIALLTEDRRLSGIFPVLSVSDNIIMSHIDSYINKLGILNKKNILKDCIDYIQSLNIKTPNMAQQIQFLSGGNQQKVLIARWLLTEPDILILDEPTRGIDVGAKSEIHKFISLLAGQGKAVIMISSEIPEILGMSDKVMVVSEGHVTGILENKNLTQDIIMAYASDKADLLV